MAGRTGREGEGRGGYRYGQELNAAVTILEEIGAGAAAGLEVRARAASHDTQMDRLVPSTGSTRLAIGPRVLARFAGGRWSAEAAAHWPVFQSMKGTQLAVDVSISLGVRAAIL